MDDEEILGLDEIEPLGVPDWGKKPPKKKATPRKKAATKRKATGNKKPRRSLHDMLRAVKEVNTLIDCGYSQAGALKRVGINCASFNRYRDLVECIPNHLLRGPKRKR